MQSITLTYKADGDVVSTNARHHWPPVEPLLGNASAKQLFEFYLWAARMVDAGMNVMVKTIKTASFHNARERLPLASQSLHRIFIFTRLDQKAEIVGP